MDIGEAVKALREGKKVARNEGWHGKHFLILISDDPFYSFKKWSIRPYVGIVAANDPEHVTPWLCSQSDLLADDWAIVEGKIDQKAPLISS